SSDLVDSNIGADIDLIDKQQVTPEYSRTSFSRDITTTGDINHEHPPVHQIRRECRSQIISAGLDNYEIQIREVRFKIICSENVEAGVFSNHSVRARPCFNRTDIVTRQ